MDEIYEYNGKQYTYAQLQEKYGDKVNDAISKFGFKQVETFSYNNKNFTRKQLEEKYGERTDEAIEKFGITSNLKKKVGGDATSSDTSSVSGQEAENGSVATPKDTKPNLVKDIDAGKYDDRIDELQAENQEAGAEQSKKEKEYSIPKEMLRSFEKGSARLGQMVGAIPEFLYDIFAIPQNAVADSFGIESLNADSEKFKDYVGIENAIKDHYTGHIDRITKEQEEKDKPIFGDITSNIKQGSYSNAFRLIGKSVSESLPSTIGIALSGGSASAPQVLGGVTTVFGAAANEEYKTENPNMNANERTIKSFGKGLAEGVFSTIGSSKIGVAAKEIIKQEGKEQGAKILKAQLTDMYTELLKKYSIPAAMVGEGIEEAATQMTQNAIDGKPIMDGVSDSFIVGAASGGAFGTALEGVKKISGAKTSPKDIENVEATKDKETSIKYELEQQVKEGDLKPSEAKEIYKNWEEIKNDLKAVPDDFSTEQKSKAVNLIKEKKSIENEIEGKEPALVEDKKARIEEINNELKSIQSKPNQESKPNNNAVSEEITPKSEPNNQINAESEKTTQETPEQPVETTTSETKVKPEEVGVEDTPAPTVELNPENTNEIPVEINPKNLKIFRGTIDKKNKNGFYALKNEDALNYAEGNEDNVISASIKDDAVVLKMVNKTEVESDEDFNDDEIEKFINIIGSKNVDQQDPSDITEVLWGEPKNIKKLKKAGIDIVIGNTIDGVSVYVVNDKSIDTNETTPTKNTEPNGNVQPGVDPSVQQGEGNQVQNTNDPATDKTKTGAPKTYQLGKTETSPKYTATFNNGVLDIKDSEGNTPTPPTRRKVETKYAQDFDFTQGDTASITPDVTDPETFIANNSNNPAEIANQLSVINTKAYIDNQIDYKTKVIADNIGRKIERQSYVDFGDANKIGKAMANAYFPEKGTGRSIDTLAQELSEDYGIEITPQDIVEHMETYTGGQNDVYKEVRDEKIKSLQDRFTQLTGLPANDKYINMAVQQAIAKEKLNEKLEKDYLDLLTEEELVSLHEDSLEYEKFKQENTETNTGNASVAKTTNTKDGKKTSGVREKDDSPDGGEKGEVDDTLNTQGVSFSKENNRDNALSKEGAVKQKNARQRKFRRFWNNTFISSRGLDKSVVRVVESLIGELSAISTAVEYEASQFSKISKHIKKSFKKDYNDKMKLVNDYLSGIDTDVSFLKTEHKDILDSLRGRIDKLSDKITNILDDKKNKLSKKKQTESVKDAIKRIDTLIETIEGNKGKYMFRQYDAFSNKDYLNALTGKHPNASAKKRLREAIEFVANDQGITEAEAKKQILTYLDDLKGGSDFVSASANGKAQAPFLKKRKNIPEPIRKLLGESKDPVKNYVSTVFNMSKYIANIEYQNRLSAVLFDSGIAKTEIEPGYTKLVKSQEGWDLLQDIYVPEEVAEGIEDLQPLDSIKDDVYKTLVMMSSLVKLGKTVLSPTTSARNFLSGIFLSFNSGFNPLTSPKKFVEGIYQAWGGKKSQTELKEQNQRLIKLGIIQDGATSKELLGIMNDFSAPIEKQLSDTWLKKAMNAMQKLYALGDDTYKVIGFYKWEKRYKKAGFNDADAEAMAAERIRNGFPTYSKIPKNIQKLRRIPLIGTFPSFTYEVFRTNYNNIKFIGQDLQAGIKNNNKQRLLMAGQQAGGMFVASSMAYGISALTKAMFGIDDDEDETTRNMSAEWQKDSKYIYLGKQDGIYEVIDATAFFPQETISKPLRILFEERDGRSIDDKVILATDAVTNSFIGADIFAKTVSELHGNKDSYGRQIYEGNSILEGLANDPDKIIHYTLRQSGPGFYNNVTEFARANNIAPDYFGDKETSYKEYTNQEAILGLLGFRVSRINYVLGINSLGYDAKEQYNFSRSELSKKLKTSQKLSEDKIDDLIKEYKTDNKKSYEVVKVAIRGAKKQGIPKHEIDKALKASNFSREDIDALYFGDTPKLKPLTSTTKKRAELRLDIGRFKNNPKKLNELKMNLNNNIDLFNFKIEVENYKKTTD